MLSKFGIGQCQLVGKSEHLGCCELWWRSRHSRNPSCKGYLAFNGQKRQRLSSPSASKQWWSSILKDFNYGTSAGGELKELLALVANTDRGIKTTKEQRKKIESYFDRLGDLGSLGTRNTVQGTWKLVWTTEKETLFILEKANIFGLQAGEVYQVIDTEQGSLQNVITFIPGDGAFIVDSNLEWVGENARTNFKFTSATLKLSETQQIKLPPFGSGWFESIYVDSKYRLSRDIRGDLLLVERQGPPTKFE